MSVKLFYLLVNLNYVFYFSKYDQNNTIMTVIIKNTIFIKKNVIKIYKYATVYLDIVNYIL